jgi:hypothetical protein
MLLFRLYNEWAGALLAQMHAWRVGLARQFALSKRMRIIARDIPFRGPFDTRLASGERASFASQSMTKVPKP